MIKEVALGKREERTRLIEMSNRYIYQKPNGKIVIEYDIAKEELSAQDYEDFIYISEIAIKKVMKLINQEKAA